MYRPQNPLGTLLIDTTDRFGKRIILEKDRFDEHIGCETGHIEMIGNVEAIKETIENPYWIAQSAKNQNRYLYIGKSEKSTYPSLYIKTVVDHSKKDFGFVVTSMFQRRLNLNKEGSIIYERQENPG
jgi:hypothetical protein